MWLPEVGHLAAACIILPLLTSPVPCTPTPPSLTPRSSCKCPLSRVFICTPIASWILWEIPLKYRKEKVTRQGGKRLMETISLNMSSHGSPCKTFAFSAKESPGSYKVQRSQFADSGFTKPRSLPVAPHWQFTICVQCLHWTAECHVSSAINKASFLSHVFCLHFILADTSKYLTMATCPWP